MGQSEWPRSIIITTELPYPNHIDGVTNLLNHTLPLLAQKGTSILLHSPPPAKGLSSQATTLGVLDWGTLNKNSRDIRPDLVWAVAPAVMGLVLLDWAKSNNIPRMVTFNTNIPKYAEAYGLGKLQPLTWAYYHHVHKMAQLNLAPSESIANEMKQHKFPNVEVWGRGVDSIFDPKKRSQDFREKVTSSNKDRPIILYVGRLAREKGLEAFEPIIRSIPQAQFVFVGDGPDRKKLENLLPYSNVTFTGFLHGEDLAVAYASSDIFATLSKTEGLPNTALEALKSGLPIVTFDAPGMREIQKESHAGLLAPSGDITAITDNLLTLLNNQDLRKKLSQKAVQYAKTQTWEQNFSKLWDYLQSLRPDKLNINYPVVEVAHRVNELHESIRQGTIWRYMPPLIHESLGTKVAKKTIRNSVSKGRLSQDESVIQEHHHIQFDEQINHPVILKIDLEGLGIQKVYSIDIQLQDQKEKDDKPPVFFIPARSGDFYGIEPIIRELFLSGRRIICVSYPESILSETTEAFANAVERSGDYQNHALFFKEAIKQLLDEERVELWGYSAGGALIGEILSDPEIANRVTNAIALSPASLVDQTKGEIDMGIGKEIWRLIHHLDEFPNISEVIGRKYNPFEDPEKVLKHKRLRNRIRNALLKIAIRKGNTWDDSRVRKGGNIYMVSGENDNIVKSNKAIQELLNLQNSQIKVVNITNGSHLTPLTKANKYTALVQRMILNQSDERYIEDSL